MGATELFSLTSAGLYCGPGDFHIDPVRPVARALITHAHSDHARPGHGAVLATPDTLAIMALRMGEQFARSTQAAAFGTTVRLGETEVCFFPAGHVLGSAQIAISHKGFRAVISGDYKRAADPTCSAFEPIACDMFVTEATFGLPIFTFADAADEIGKLVASLALFPARTHLVGAYSLGKAQRIMALLRHAGWDRPIYMHGAMERVTSYYIDRGIDLGEVIRIDPATRAKRGGDVVLCPPSALHDLWSRKFPEPVAAYASGWMRTRARARQTGAELPLVISDHADWPALCATIRETGCSEVWVTHGEADALVHWALAQGLAAKPLHLLGYGDEEAKGDDEAAGAAA